MSIRVLICEHPNRAIALATSTQALIFRHSPASFDTLKKASHSSLHSTQTRKSLDVQSQARCIVEFSSLESVDLADYHTLSPLPVFGTLGLITVASDIFLCVVSAATKVASVRPGETVEKILGVEFYCLSSSEYDPYPINNDPYNSEYGQNVARQPVLEHPCSDLQKLLGSGSFYYSTDFDLTNRLQDRSAEVAAFDIDALDDSFLWNSYMIKPLVRFRSQLVPQERQALDESRILTSAIRGFVHTSTIPVSSAPVRNSTTGLPSSLTLVSRLSCRRAGTRFNSRGIDDDGNVANFVETETVYWSNTGLCFSYVQVRGSVPIFWEQAPGLIPGQQKISITRSKEGTQPAFDAHFRDLEQTYGSVHVVNLLSETKPGEAELTKLYKHGIRYCPLSQTGGQSRDHRMLEETEFDFHAETKENGYESASMIRHLIEGSADGFAYYLSEEVVDAPKASSTSKAEKRAVVVLQQEGVFRTNCLDCLDRTNLIQTILSQMAMESFLSHRGDRASADFWMRHSSLWADNGDALSRIYAGTGALKSSFTRHGKMSLAGAFADARKSATRLYINNFADKDRQNTMDVLLGRLVGQSPVVLFDPVNDYVTTELNKRSAEFMSTDVLKLWAGTYNLNGKPHGVNEDLSAWLCPEMSAKDQPDMVVVGFQEIVELSPQQIMNSDPTIKQAWEKSVKVTLNTHASRVGSENYVLLRSGQLVGAALCIFVKASTIKNIKNVEGAVKKTGMSGMAGNKGAVAIRMEYANTQICFVTAHLAAGFANYDERNKDYHTIHHGLRFLRNRGIDDHDTVIWLGDFNYRIGMSSERVRHLISTSDLQTLYENDQLNIQMVQGLAFPHYAESRITFMPTYKFDLGSDNYDSSEKQRIPAWTDRILYKGDNVRQTSYCIAPLRFSDHRPVYGLFECIISIINEEVRDALSSKLFEKRKTEVGSVAQNSSLEDTDDEELIGYDSIEPGLPPASSNTSKWWLDSGQPARSTLQPPSRDAVLNPNRSPNPYHKSDEPDWVTVPRMTATRKDSSQSGSPSPSAGSRVTPLSNSSSNTRKLPPPFAGGSIPFRERSAAPIGATPTYSSSRRPSNASTTSQSSTISRKSAPPVSKKPLHLTGSSSTSLTTLTTKPPGPGLKSTQPKGDVASLTTLTAKPPDPGLKPTQPKGHVASNAASLGKAAPTPYFEPPPKRNPDTNGTSRTPFSTTPNNHSSSPSVATSSAPSSGRAHPALLAVRRTGNTSASASSHSLISSSSSASASASAASTARSATRDPATRPDADMKKTNSIQRKLPPPPTAAAAIAATRAALPPSTALPAHPSTATRSTRQEAIRPVDSDRGPRLPPRHVDLLASSTDEPDELGGWETLRPNR